MGRLQPEFPERMDRMDRRRFLTAAAAAVAAPGVLEGVAQGRPQPGYPDRPARQAVLKVGVIGCGGRGTGAALQAVKADPGAVLWAMGDLFGDRIESCAAALGKAIDREEASAAEGGESESSGASSLQERVNVPEERRFSGFDNYQRVIESGVDVVLLTAPPVFRPEHLRAAVAAGKHVFAEKPVAVDSAGVRSVLDSARAAKEKRLSLVSGFCWRYNARDRATQALIREGAIGDVRAIHTTYNAQGWNALKPCKPAWSEAECHLRNWHYDVRLSGDHIVEQAVHMIDKINWIKGGPPVQCVAVGGAQARTDGPEWCNVWDHFSVTYEYADGTRAFHMCRHWPNTSWDNRDYVIGAKGVCRVDPWAGVYEIDAGGRPTWRCDVEKNNMYQQEHDELMASIRARRPINDGEWMAHSTLMAIMGRMAAYTGRTVTWEEALQSEDRIAPQEWELGSFPEWPSAVPGKAKA